MLPIVFGDCFGWLHPGARSVGVVICPGIGRDASEGYGVLRTLAIELARSGFPTLRFDYPGTGDSLDTVDDDASPAWIGSIGEAARWLRHTTGVRQIVLCGLRLGALLAAAAAAAHDDVYALALLDPVIAGRGYLREQSIAAQLASGLSQFGEESGQEFGEERLEAAGVPLAGERASSLRSLDLLAMTKAPAAHILILTSSSSPVSARLAERMRALGADVAQGAFERMRDLDDNGLVNPPSDLGEICRWLERLSPGAARHTAPQLAANEATLRTNCFVEQPLRFGMGEELFGILCRPRTDAEPDFVLLIGNTGGSPHHGYGRFHVRLARRLAAAGVASLRLDFKGVGDSGLGAIGPRPHVFGTDRTADLAAGVDALWAMGYRRFGVAGLSSGAYHAFRFSLADDRVTALAMLGLATFTWKEGRSIQAFLDAHQRSTRFYVAAMRQGNGWTRLLRGELDVRRAMRTVRTHAARRVATAAARVLDRLGWQNEDAFPRQAMRSLSARGVRTLLLLGTTDGGLNEVLAHFGRGGHHLAALPGSMVRLVPEIDHSLTRIKMQEQVAEILLDFVRAAADASG